MGIPKNNRQFLFSLLFSFLLSLPLGAANGGGIVLRPGQPLQIATMDMPEFGLSTRNAVDLAIEQFGNLQGHPIKTKHYGRGCDERKEMDGFIQGLIREPKTLGLVGPICSGRTVRIVQTLSDAKILTISPANTFSGFSDPAFHELIPYYFRTAPSDQFQGGVGAEFAISPKAQNGLGATTAAIIYYGDDEAGYSSVLRQGFREAFIAAGGTIVGEFPIQFGQTDFNDALDEMGEAEVVYAPIFDPPVIGGVAGRLDVPVLLIELAFVVFVGGAIFFAASQNRTNKKTGN